MSACNSPVSADLFCRVVDNLGDIGVMWRLARQVSQEKNWQVRLWVDNLASLAVIEPRICGDRQVQTCAGVDVHGWPDPWQPTEPHPVVIAGFSCELPDDYLSRLNTLPQTVWVQLEYLSAEPWTTSFHGLQSQRNDNLKPIFFFPGFNQSTGGLLREHDLVTAQQAWATQETKQQWLASLGVKTNAQTRLVSVFTYPNAPLNALIAELHQTGQRFHLLIASNKPEALTSSLPTPSEPITWQVLPFLAQTDYDKLLWSCDLNLVRGEDSFVRAIWAGKPFIWQIYPQADGAHHAKLQAWLELAHAPASAGLAMHEWADGSLKVDLSGCLTSNGWRQWQTSAQALRGRLLEQQDLATRLDLIVRQRMGA